ncbi:MAG TPA: phospho-N-acetylmuramoyl-pentapeptide-transferase [Candidatus Pygmaiobacter gallistercoris]|nr:phospho-N-acetylmuramoyl-pentapeptide-transferase [Candidatus Pygmaiobacter gallistercoris]
MARLVLVIAALLSLIVTALSGFFILPWLKRLHYGQNIKEVGPTWHNKKQGTPMMGGLMFILGSITAIAVAFGTLLVAQPDLLSGLQAQQCATLLISLMATIGFSFVGFVDDYLKVVHKQNLGLSARYKILMQIVVTTAYLAAMQLNGTLSTAISLPAIGRIDFGLAFYPLAYFVIIGFVNAVNLTDGLDGLCSGVTFVAMLGYMTIATLLGYYMMGIFGAAMAGGCAGFLFWNFYPAKVFMGDTGSMFLGGAVVTVSFGIGRPELLLLLGIIYWIEAGSVILQVSYFKLTHGKRIFKMSPIHHHFEMCGWSEVRIDATFAFITLIGVLLGFVYIYLN